MSTRARIVLAVGVVLLIGLIAGAYLLWRTVRWRYAGDQAKRQRIATLYRRYERSFPGVPGISVDEFLRLRERDNVVMVDTREPYERTVSMIPGAVSAEVFERDLQQYRRRRIVTYCTIGLRSGLYARDLRSRGLDAANLVGGVLAWAHAGRAFVDRQGETRRVHVFGRQWDLLPMDYQPVLGKSDRDEDP